MYYCYTLLKPIHSLFCFKYNINYDLLTNFSSSSGIVNNGSVMSSQIPVGEILLNDIALNNYGRTLYMASGDKVKIWDLRK